MILFDNRAAFLLAALLICVGNGSARAQSSCSSDGQRPPAALLERFISADCADCWSDPATPKVKPTEFALDWIVPSAKGDDAPLSAAASPDALPRLEALRMQVSSSATNTRRSNASTPTARMPTLRVANGVALGGYMGTSIELKLAPGAGLPRQPLTAWLLLVEAVPAGTDGSPVARNLVRNAIFPTWNIDSLLLKTKQVKSDRLPTPSRLYESRPMSIPPGTNPDHLRVVGWVEDAGGNVVASAASVCAQ
jgi:hypothetical protein